MLRIGIDMGGTFTDFAAYDEKNGRISLEKIPTSQAKPWAPIIRYIQDMAQAGQCIADIRHGTTIGVNAVVEKKESLTGLLTTEGFKDLLEIGRQKRPHLYDLRAAARPPLIGRGLRIGIGQRVSAQGKIIKGLDEGGLEKAAELFKRKGVESVAILFLHSYINPAHELKAKEFLKRRLPGVFLTPSCEVISQFREYERLSTTAVNAYLKPVMVDYLQKLLKKIGEINIKAPFYISQSDGGITSARTAMELPVRTLYSGPSAGAVGCAHFYGKVNPHIISLDMGGTSTDLALISSEHPVTTTGKTVAGYPILFPSIDINTIGAGGGSIAFVDEGGFLQVGPSSAGAHPGPACYGQGGKKPTVTDACLALGILGQDTMLGGKMKINKAQAQQAIKEYICSRLETSVRESAQAIIRLAVSHIADSIRKISILKGIHPQDLKLVAYGGSGPMHAADIARDLGIREVIVPASPGVFSAVGLLCSNLTMDFVKTVKGPLAHDFSAIARELKAKGDLWFKQEKIPTNIQKAYWSADLRYRGQNYEINIKLGESILEKGIDPGSWAKAFHQKHARLYGHSLEEKEVEIINLRLKCIGLMGAGLKKRPKLDAAAKTARSQRLVYFAKTPKAIKTPVLDKGQACLQKEITGPAIIQGVDSTTVITPQDKGLAKPNGDLIIKVGL